MTRKRLIKLLMSHGISRNEAVKIAAEYNSLNIPYETAYVTYVREMTKPCISITFDTPKIKQGIAAATAALRDLASAVRRSFEIGRC